MAEDREILRRIETKLDNLSEKVITLSAREAARDQDVDAQKEDIAKLKAAYHKAAGIFAFVTFPGVFTILWMGLQLYMKKS